MLMSDNADISRHYVDYYKRINYDLDDNNDHNNGIASILVIVVMIAKMIIVQITQLKPHRQSRRLKYH